MGTVRSESEDSSKFRDSFSLKTKSKSLFSLIGIGIALIDIKSTNFDMLLREQTSLINALRNLAAVGHALGDETRLRILSLLLERGETCVCELMETVGKTQSNVSFHLTVLKNTGLITHKKIGKWMFYRINLNALQQHLTTMRTTFSKTRLGAARPGTSIFTLCSRKDAVPLSRKHARQKAAELKSRDKTARLLAGRTERR